MLNKVDSCKCRTQNCYVMLSSIILRSANSKVKNTWEIEGYLLQIWANLVEIHLIEQYTKRVALSCRLAFAKRPFFLLQLGTCINRWRTRLLANIYCSCRVIKYASLYSIVFYCGRSPRDLSSFTRENPFEILRLATTRIVVSLWLYRQLHHLPKHLHILFALH